MPMLILMFTFSHSVNKHFYHFHLQITYGILKDIMNDLSFKLIFLWNIFSISHLNFVNLQHKISQFIFKLKILMQPISVSYWIYECYILCNNVSFLTHSNMSSHMPSLYQFRIMKWPVTLLALVSALICVKNSSIEVSHCQELQEIVGILPPSICFIGFSFLLHILASM